MYTFYQLIFWILFINLGFISYSYSMEESENQEIRDYNYNEIFRNKLEKLTHILRIEEKQELVHLAINNAENRIGEIKDLIIKKPHLPNSLNMLFKLHLLVVYSYLRNYSLESQCFREIYPEISNFHQQINIRELIIDDHEFLILTAEINDAVSAAYAILTKFSNNPVNFYILDRELVMNKFADYLTKIVKRTRERFPKQNVKLNNKKMNTSKTNS